MARATVESFSYLVKNGRPLWGLFHKSETARRGRQREAEDAREVVEGVKGTRLGGETSLETAIAHTPHWSVREKRT